MTQTGVKRPVSFDGRTYPLFNELNNNLTFSLSKDPGWITMMTSSSQISVKPQK